MARHRNVRGYNYDDDFEDEDFYGHSVEDDYCISPATAAQFIYSKRDRHTSFTEPLEEEEEDNDFEKTKSEHLSLSSVDQAQLYSCLEHMREVLGDSVVEQVMIDAVLQCQFDVAKALDLVFKQDCNRNMKPDNQELASTERPTKEAILPYHRNLNTEQNESFSGEKWGKSTRTAIGERQICIGLGSSSDGRAEKSVTSFENENAFSDIKSSLSLSTLITASPDETFSTANPTSVFKISLFDLIKDSEVNSDITGSGQIGTKLSEIGSPCFNNLLDIPDLQMLMSNELDSSTDTVQYKQCSVKDFKHETSRKMTQDNKLLHDQEVGLFGSLSSFLQNSELSVPKDGDASVLKYGSPSLAELIQEHNEINPLEGIPFSGAQKNSFNNGLVIGSLLPLSEVSDTLQTAIDMPSLSESLSSLAVSDNLAIKEPPVSLLDLIAESSTPVCEDHNRLSNTMLLNQPARGIDLGTLIKSSGNHASACVLNQKARTPNTPADSPKKHSLFDKIHSSKKKKCRAKILKARPSAFALTMCFNYIPKTCQKSILKIHHNSFVDLNKEFSKPTLVPFDFQTPSPDDIVKGYQKKAFER